MTSGRLAGQQDGGPPGAGLGDAGFDELKPGQKTRDVFPGVMAQVSGLILVGELLAGLAVQMPC
jgi:hypothetical protein